MTRIATVFGATGKQGTSVVRALLADGTFKPRAITRDVNSPAARKLAEQGCEVVQADMADKEAVKRAVAGTGTVFAVTVPFTAISELDQGISIIDASKEAGVQFLVFSTLPSLKALSNGKYPNITPAEEKAEVQKYLESSGLPHACIATGNFLENVLASHVGLPPFSKTEHGYVMHLLGKPDMVLPWTWIDRDMGPAVTALIKQYDTRASEIIGKTFVLGVARATAEEVAAELAKGKPCLDASIESSADCCIGLGKPVEVKCVVDCAVPVVNDMYAFSTEFEWYPGVELPDPRLEKLGVEVGSIEEFARTTLKAYGEV
ncbi:hypothetical protein EV715DRAFT_287222 [Schizophyllum commune]